MPSLATPAIADDELVDMLSLIKGADSVELKLTIPETSQRSTIQALGIDPIGAQVRLVHFFDTPDLTLEKAGVVVRARRVARRATTRWSSCGLSWSPSCRPSCASRRSAWSRSTPFPAATSAQRR
jgi:hypothetical protein